jgi:hypothetical protein
MMEKIPARIRIAVLLILAISGSLGLGFSLAGIFAKGPGLEAFLGARLVPLFLAFFFSGSFFLVLSLTTKAIVQMSAVFVCSIAFGFPFLLQSGSIDIPLGFVALVSFVYAAALLTLNYTAKRAVATHSIFLARMFSNSYGRFFQIFVFSVGILVYFSSQLSIQVRFNIPEGVLAPALNLVVNQVINQVQSQLGNEQFTEEQFLTELEKSGVLKVLEQQYGILLNPQDVSTPQKLAEGLRQPITEQLTHDLEGLLEPYLPLLPLATAVGVALSLLFLTPIFAWSSAGFFALVYRIMVFLKFASLEQETRQVTVLKIV